MYAYRKSGLDLFSKILISLFCSRKLVKDMHTLVSPRDRSENDMSSSGIVLGELLRRMQGRWE